MLRKFFNKAMLAIKTYGPIKAIYWMLFGYFQVNKFMVYRQLLDKSVCTDDVDDDLSVKYYLPEELEPIRKNPDFNTYEVSISSYLKTSGCLIGYINEMPAHIMWIFRKGDDSRLFDLQQDEAELNYCYTPESFRGRGVYARMIRKASDILKSEGISMLYMATHETNDAAQKAITRAGLVKIGTVSNFGMFYRPKWKPE